MSATASGVTWDLSRFFPAFDGPEMQQFKKALADDIASLRQKAGALGPLDAETAAAWEAVVLTDVELLRAFKAVGQAAFEAFIARERLKPVAHALRRVRQRAGFSMSSAEEILAADLNVDGLDAWGRLYDQVTGKLAFEFVDKNGKTEHRPISQWRTLMSDPDREIGRSAFAGGNRAWAGIADMCAAALNAIAGTRLTLYRHRGVAHFLDRALFQAGIQRETLEAMYAAIHDRIDTARAILRAKAEFLGRKGIWFFEREAPLPLAETGRCTWRQATEKVAAAFDSGYPDLAGYFRAMLDKRWVEAEQRPAKRPGAFCTDSPLTGEQRVFMTFNGALGNITTLAHEVGHAWHSHLLRDLRRGAGFPAENADVRHPAPDLRRHPAGRRCRSVFLGFQAALLYHRGHLLQLPLHLRFPAGPRSDDPLPNGRPGLSAPLRKLPEDDRQRHGRECLPCDPGG